MIPRVLPLLLLLLVPALAAGQEADTTAADAAIPAELAATPETLEQADAGFTTGTEVLPNPGQSVEAQAGPQAEPAASVESAENTEPDATAEPAVPEASPVVAPVPPVQSVQEEERTNSIIILVAAVSLIAALLAIIVLLIRRGRELRPAQAYVAEAHLNDIQGSTAQATYKLGSKPVMLGRVAGKDTEHVDYIVIPQSTIGRRHALIEYKDFAYWIMDQGSINGTFVNDQPVTSEIRLKHGDRVRLHKYQFDFLMPDVGETGKTVVAHAGAKGPGREKEAKAAAMSAEEAELLRNLSVTGGEPLDRKPDALSGKESTLLPSRGSAAGASGSEETLLPAGAATGADSAEETLLPGGDPAHEAAAVESEDETLLPGSGSPPPAARVKPADEDKDSSGEFFDITGSDKDAGK